MIQPFYHRGMLEYVNLNKVLESLHFGCVKMDLSFNLSSLSWGKKVSLAFIQRLVYDFDHISPYDRKFKSYKMRSRYVETRSLVLVVDWDNAKSLLSVVIDIFVYYSLGLINPTTLLICFIIYSCR